MSQEPLTNSEKYVKKTNSIILMIGLSSLVVFILGLVLLVTSGEEQEVYEEPVFTDNADVFGDIPTTTGAAQGIEFSTMDGEDPITMTPDPVPMGEVVLGADAHNVLTIGTNGKNSIKIVSVELAEAPTAGFTFDDKCTGITLAGEEVCHIKMSWAPVVAGNVQNNYIISWHEVNLGKESIKAAKVPVTGSAVEKEDCTACVPEAGTTVAADGSKPKGDRQAIGPDGKVVGEIDEDGYVRDANGNIIGRVGSDGLIVDENGNITTVYAEYDPDTKTGMPGSSRKVKGTLHWVSCNHCLKAEVRLYDRLWKVENPRDEMAAIREAKNCDALEAMKEMINQDSLKVLTECYVEKYLADAKPLDYLQFQRIGYFNVDKDSTPEHLIFNRTVSLKDTWSKINK